MEELTEYQKGFIAGMRTAHLYFDKDLSSEPERKKWWQSNHQTTTESSDNS